jgi:disulfide oxidoreductase YuzD
MAPKTPKTPTWLSNVEDHDFPAAESFLCLIYPAATVKKLLASLKAAPIATFKAKDIFRASQLSLLGVSNSHVEKDTRKIAAGSSLSPLLLVRDETHGRVVIADGYHRLCAVYAVDEDALIPCKIV